jgi:uncharacterized protein YpmB
MKKIDVIIIFVALAVGAYLIFKKSTANVSNCTSSALPYVQGPTLAQLTGNA